MHPYLFNAAQEKLLIYRIPMSNYDVINFKYEPDFINVWAPYLTEFLSRNINSVNHMPFYRTWYDKEKIITPLTISDNYSAKFLTARAQEILHDLPLFPNTPIGSGFNDGIACYVGNVYHREDLTRMVQTTTGQHLFLDSTSLVFNPDTFKLTRPADSYTQGMENTFLTYQRELFNMGLKSAISPKGPKPHAQLIIPPPLN